MKLSAVTAALVACLLCNPAQATDDPTLTVTEAGGGMWVFTGIGAPGALTVTQGALITFSWSAVPGGGTVITDYRYGWDLLDPNDDEDPGWTSWGSAQTAPPTAFFIGVHTFTAEARNDLGQIARGTIVITLEPSVSVQTSTWGAIKALFR
jgi:hypothetical protein